jgi:hypothetical protein
MLPAVVYCGGRKEREPTQKARECSRACVRNVDSVSEFNRPACEKLAFDRRAEQAAHPAHFSTADTAVAQDECHKP